jgi:hypothetical protein
VSDASVRSSCAAGSQLGNIYGTLGKRYCAQICACDAGGSHSLNKYPYRQVRPKETHTPCWTLSACFSTKANNADVATRGVTDEDLLLAVTQRLLGNSIPSQALRDLQGKAG